MLRKLYDLAATQRDKFHRVTTTLHKTLRLTTSLTTHPQEGLSVTSSRGFERFG
jgi:hypothetical protein